MIRKAKTPVLVALRFLVPLNRRESRRSITMHKHTSKSELKVDGKMSEKGADRAGQIQALTQLGLVIGLIIVAIILALK